MSGFNISSFIRLMQTGLIENDTQEATGILLLESIEVEEQELPNINSRMISNLVNHKSDVLEIIKKASARPEVIANAIVYFEDVVVPDLNPHLKDDTCSKIVNLLEFDASVPKSKSDELISLSHKGTLSEFLARSFLYALGRANKQIENDLEVEDAYLINEVKNECPLCHDLLVKSVKGRALQRYRITKIYPEGLSTEDAELFQNKRQPAKKLNSYDNKIALCANCSETYDFEVEFAEYVELFDIKEQYATRHRIQQELNNMTLEDDIKDVIDALGNIEQTTELEKFNLKVLKISQKILPENAILLDDLRSYVLKYYRFIEGCLSETGNFESIAVDIKKAFIKFDKIYQTQDEVVYQLAKWILQKTRLSDKHLRVCHIIIAFFVQNCEVFYEIAK